MPTDCFKKHFADWQKPITLRNTLPRHNSPKCIQIPSKRMRTPLPNPYIVQQGSPEQPAQLHLDPFCHP